MASPSSPGGVVYAEMPATRRIHWKVPAVMGAAILIGALSALGHHLFYQSLNGQPVSDAQILIFGASHQQLNIAVGTAFSFLVKACLVFAVGIAFIQVFWSGSHAPSTTQAPTLKRLDSMYGSRRSIFSVLNPALWLKNPVLLVVAAIAWLIPIASIITPSTLSIRSAAILPPPKSMVNVPYIDFRSLNFVNLMSPKGTCFNYTGPNPAVSRVANAVMATGEILPFKAPDVNASWELEFSGPSLKCDHVVGDAFTPIRKNIGKSEITNFNYYASWFPLKSGNKSNQLPFGVSIGNGTAFSKGSLVPANSVDLAFYMAVMPFLGPFGPIAQNITTAGYQKLATEIRNFTLIQCQLVNSTYKTTFNFTNGAPNITSRVTYVNDAQILQSIQSTCTNGNNNRGTFEENCLPSDRTCVFHRDFYETLSYQAVADAFGRQISGLISGEVSLDASSDVNLVAASNVLNTVLAETSDLINIVPGQVRHGSVVWSLSLQRHMNQLYPGLVNKPGGGRAVDLPKAVEQLFQNVTVSLMTSAALQPNNTTLNARGPVEVTIHRYHNVYDYSAWKLCVPYGIAIILAALAALVGLHRIMKTATTYSDSFSTVFRAARGAKLSKAIRDEDLDARYPSPAYVQGTKICLPNFGKTANSSHHTQYESLASPEVPSDYVFPSHWTDTKSGLLKPYEWTRQRIKPLNFDDDVKAGH